jgi:hypothetical protein
MGLFNLVLRIDCVRFFIKNSTTFIYLFFFIKDLKTFITFKCMYCFENERLKYIKKVNH